MSIAALKNFRVVINNEEQYSILSKQSVTPCGWQDEGTVGTKDECLSYIDVVWHDMMPSSLRKKINCIK